LDRESEKKLGRTMTTLVFVHGACVRDAEWWWSRMVQPLATLGVATVAVALPSCGENGLPLGDLFGDVAACRQAIAQVRGPVVLCGHSYGGMVITEAGADENVTQLVYVTSIMPDAGESQAELTGSEPAPWLQPGEDGTIGVDPDMIREYFLQDCDESTTEQALVRLTRHSRRPLARSRGDTSPPPTSSARRILPRRLRCSADESRQAPILSILPLAITLSFLVPRISREASRRYSIEVERASMLLTVMSRFRRCGLRK
jgi:pimeloyl-ACP methyl ester carboxylesterase